MIKLREYNDMSIDDRNREIGMLVREMNIKDRDDRESVFDVIYHFIKCWHDEYCRVYYTAYNDAHFWIKTHSHVDEVVPIVFTVRPK